MQATTRRPTAFATDRGTCPVARGGGGGGRRSLDESGLLPFALSGDAHALIIHASRPTPHTAGLVEGAPFDALVHEPVTGDVNPLKMRRVTLRCEVRAFPEDDAARTVSAGRASYLAKVPEAEPITVLGDFAFFRLEITRGRLVSGFGGAVNLTARTLPSLLAVGTPVAGDFPTN